MFFNPTTKAIELNTAETQMLMQYAHGTPFSTGKILIRLLATHSANFEQDIKDTINELESEQS